MHQNNTVGPQDFQDPAFLDLFNVYTGNGQSIGAHLAEAAERATVDAPLLVATNSDFVLFPGAGAAPQIEGYRLSTRGFKELTAVSHLAPALASLVRLRELAPASDAWRGEAERLLVATRGARAANSATLWRERIAVPAYRGREAAIANMVDYACAVTERYIERVLATPERFTAHDLREQYLEARGDLEGACVPMNAVMIATFFLVGMDTGHRVIDWFNRHRIDWSQAMVLIVGRQGRPTAGVTWSSNAVAAMILAASGHRLDLSRLYIAPHAPPFTVARPLDLEAVRAQEGAMRRLWNYTRAISDLGEIMYHGYPHYAANSAQRPVLTPETQAVADLPAIAGPDDWRAFNTRLRVILEDPRQLLAGCVADYAVDQLQAHSNDPTRLTVPGLDCMAYPAA
ncbi:DUF5624 domain-containing protein [Variovorax terrae]|uniref:DUF5624 domain-containing protein n=1 Tax=Variovorax terrae TaxID=2923278 RepID=A0A9X1VSL3_9BURK|nr:DUF5624 domain-containing protein [Variovorax terrae]MCJ0762582.1 DUF5624 domain-containing protein [Variovorax terrae]